MVSHQRELKLRRKPMTLPHLNLLLAIIGLVVVAYAVNTSVDQRLPTMTLNFSY